MGFVLLGLLSGVVNGYVDPTTVENAYSSAMFYVVTYVLTTLAAFGVVLLLAREGFESEEIADLAGLNQRSPLYAGVMAFACSRWPVSRRLWVSTRLSVLRARWSLQDSRSISLSGRVCCGDVADRRVLLPAHRQGHVL